MEIFEVGGCVRDSIMGRASKDVDYTIVGFDTFDQMVDWVRTQGEVFVVTPETFTARARVGRDVFDYVWARKEGPYSDGRHPDWVERGTLRDDLARRDFTINAIARREGVIFDPFDGRGDIARGVVRAVGDARQRFTEDALRIARGVRFAVRFGFAIETGTAAAMTTMSYRLRETKLRDRVREEMVMSFKENTIATFRLLEDLGITEDVFCDGLWAKPTTEK